MCMKQDYKMRTIIIVSLVVLQFLKIFAILIILVTIYLKFYMKLYDSLNKLIGLSN